jgi:hypothetical protein
MKRVICNNHVRCRILGINHCEHMAVHLPDHPDCYLSTPCWELGHRVKELELTPVICIEVEDK